jgi:hypothetical protein
MLAGLGAHAPVFLSFVTSAQSIEFLLKARTTAGSQIAGVALPETAIVET